MFFKKSDFIQIGGFDKTLPAWQDFDLWLRLMELKGRAFCTGASTYVVDQTHPHERISNSKRKWQNSVTVLKTKYPTTVSTFVTGT